MKLGCFFNYETKFIKIVVDNSPTFQHYSFVMNEIKIEKVVDNFYTIMPTAT